VAVAVVVLLRFALPQPRLTEFQRLCVTDQVLALAASHDLLVAGASVPEPGRSSVVRTFDVSASGGLESRGKVAVPGEVSRVATDGDFAYVAADGFHVVDVRDRDRPQLVASLDWDMPFKRTDGSVVQVPVSGEWVRGLVLSDNLAVIQVPFHGVGFVDVSRPQQPALRAWVQLPHGSTEYGVTVNDHVAYTLRRGIDFGTLLTGQHPYGNGLAPALPTVAVPSDADQCGGLMFDSQQSILYIAGQGLHVVDLQTPAAPRYAGHADRTIWWSLDPRSALASEWLGDIVVTEQAALVIANSGMVRPSRAILVDRREPLQPRLYSVAPALGQVWALAAYENRVFAASKGDGTLSCYSQIITAQLSVTSGLR
jgi:hypothetical protein